MNNPNIRLVTIILFLLSILGVSAYAYDYISKRDIRNCHAESLETVLTLVKTGRFEETRKLMEDRFSIKNLESPDMTESESVKFTSTVNKLYSQDLLFTKLKKSEFEKCMKEKGTKN